MTGNLKGERMKTIKEQTTIRLPVELKETLMTEAYNYGVSFNEYLLILIYKARQCQQ